MLIVVDYIKVIKKVRGKWRYVYRPIYEDGGKGAGLNKSKDPSIFSVKGETIKV